MAQPENAYPEAPVYSQPRAESFVISDVRAPLGLRGVIKTDLVSHVVDPAIAPLKSYPLPGSFSTFTRGITHVFSKPDPFVIHSQ